MMKRVGATRVSKRFSFIEDLRRDIERIDPPRDCLGIERFCDGRIDPLAFGKHAVKKSGRRREARDAVARGKLFF